VVVTTKLGARLASPTNLVSPFGVTVCLIAYTWPGHAEDAFKKYHATYCPRTPVNHAELQKAIAEETEKFFSAAPKSQALVAVQALCRRFPDLSAQCQAMIDGLSAKGN
jgi:hypothetical protein